MRNRRLGAVVPGAREGEMGRSSGRRFGVVAGLLFLLSVPCWGQGGGPPEWFYWFVDHPSSPTVLPIGLPRWILDGDFNGDGNADLIIEAYRGPFIWEPGPDHGLAEITVVMLLGDGEGGFRNPTIVLKTRGVAGVRVVADVNGDGHLDLVLLRKHITEAPWTEVQAMFGDGKGGFAPPVTLFEIADVVWDISFADVNGDAYLDCVVVTVIREGVCVFLGSETGFAYHGSIRLGEDPAFLPHKVVLADFNHDGRLDLAIAGEVYEDHDRRTRLVAVFLGDGTGGFPENSFFVTFEPPEDETPFINLLLVDYDHDGNLDLVTSRQEDVFILLGKGDGTFEKHMDFWVADPDPWIVSVTDFNADGCWDWVIIHSPRSWSRGGVRIIVRSCGTFAGRAFFYHGRHFIPWAAVVDANNDGRPDVVYLTGHGREGDERTALWVVVNDMRREEGK